MDLEFYLFKTGMDSQEAAVVIEQTFGPATDLESILEVSEEYAWMA
jgi:hypothetical protein